MIPIKQFVTAGKAVFTITDNTSGNHYTYRVNRAEKRDPRELSKFFVSLGVGYSDSVYMGMLVYQVVEEGPNPLKFIRTKASRVGTNAPSWRVFSLFWDSVMDDTIDSLTTITFRHEGKCCVCSRPLTNPVSIDAGIGPECAGKESA